MKCSYIFQKKKKLDLVPFLKMIFATLFNLQRRRRQLDPPTCFYNLRKSNSIWTTPLCTREGLRAKKQVTY